LLFITVVSILSDEVETDSACAGENVKVRLDSVEEDEISKVNLSNDKLVFLFIIHKKIIFLVQSLFNLNGCNSNSK